MNLSEERKKLPIFSIRNRLISEIHRNPTLILLGKNEINSLTKNSNNTHHI